MVRELSTPQRQLVEVAKARARSASLLVMDEPTSSLGREGAEEVLRIVREVARRGLGVLYVSHRLDEVLSIADRVTILRDGKVAGSGRASDFRVADIVQMMVGMGAGAKAGDHTVEGVALDGGAVSAEGQVLTAVPKGDGALTREVALEVEHLRVGGLVDDVSFSVGVGEIVGLAGLVGSGRTELARGIAGLDRVESGSVRMRGQVLRPGRSAAAVRAGLVYAPEERKSAGLFLDMSIAENVSIMCLEEAMRWGFLRPERERRIGESFVRTLSIRTTNARARVRTLSGGNQQKVVLAKQLASGAGVLLLDEPTRGVDVAAKTEIYGLMRDVAAQGKAVLFISSEFEELVGLCDRVIVLRRGRVACELGRSEVTLGSLMAAASSAG
jgi:ribose transport system ATP-binding protein